MFLKWYRQWEKDQVKLFYFLIIHLKVIIFYLSKLLLEQKASVQLAICYKSNGDSRF